MAELLRDRKVEIDCLVAILESRFTEHTMRFDPYEGITITLPFTPVAKKNDVVIKRGRGGKHYPAKSDEVKQQEFALRTLVEREVRRRRLAEPLFDRTAKVRARIWWNPVLDRVRIHLFQCGTRKKHPRRDAANVPALILDALQGPCYSDDKQVAELEVITEE